MKAYINNLVGAILIWLTACSSPENSAFVDSNSIKYYREYDVFSNKPIQSLNNKPISMPYVKIQYENDTTFDVYYISNSDALKRSFRKSHSNILRYTIYRPEPYFNFEISIVGSDSIISYLFNCNDVPRSIFELTKEDSCNCWLSAYYVDTRKSRKSYYYDDEKKILLQHVSLFNDSERKLHHISLIGSCYEKIIDQNERILVIYTTDRFGDEFSGNFDTLCYDKKLTPSINWAPPLK